MPITNPHPHIPTPLFPPLNAARTVHLLRGRPRGELLANPLSLKFSIEHSLAHLPGWNFCGWFGNGDG